MKEWFIKELVLVYSWIFYWKKIEKVCFSTQCQKSKNVEKVVPLFVTYHTLFNKLPSITYMDLYLLYMNQEVKNVFTTGPIVSFRCARKISSYLVRAKLYHLGRKVDSKKLLSIKVWILLRYWRNWHIYKYHKRRKFQSKP